MAEPGRQQEETISREGALAAEIPSRNLPPVSYRDLPEPLPLGKVLGPSAVLMGASIASGEFVLWPFITSQVGLVFMWAAVVGVLTQYFINMEIERYTLATGETAVTGFSRLWKPWGLFFIAATLGTLLWPGWATGSATLLTFALGGGDVVLITILGIVALGITVTFSPVVYQVVEKLIFVKIGVMILFFAISVVLVIEARTWGNLITANVSNFGQLPEGIAPAVLLGALALAGAGGSGNLVQSNWVRDKGLGMGIYIPRIVSPITGQEEARPSIGHFFPQDEQNMRRWKGWWRVAHWEQFWAFFVLGALSIVFLSVLAYATVFGQDVGEGFDFLRAEGEALKEIVAPWFGTIFWLVGAVALLGATLANLEIMGRIIADVLKTGYLRESRFWSESKLYLAIVWTYVIVASVILLSGLDQPLVLLVIASALSGGMMFVYSMLLIKLNRGVLPDAIKLRGIRLVAMIWAVLLYGFFSVVVVFDQFFGG